MKRIIMMVAVVSAIVMTSSCDRYDDGRPDKDVRHEFERMYPDAWDVEWEYDGIYWEVDFKTGPRPGGVEHNAYYDLSGNWMWTMTEISLASVPQKIKDYLAASEYGGSQIVDRSVDFYETPTGDFYRFDLIAGGREVEVDVTEDGKVSLAGYGF